MAAGDVWKIEDHVCLICLGRVASKSGAEAGAREYRCTNCGTAGKGSVKSICACGSKVGRRDAGIRCVKNDQQRPGFIAEIIAKEAC